MKKLLIALILSFTVNAAFAEIAREEQTFPVSKSTSSTEATLAFNKQANSSEGWTYTPEEHR